MKPKRLTWTESSKPNEDVRYDHTRAETPFGTYLITWKSWKEDPGYDVEFGHDFVTAEYGSLENAKEAAQRDFDRRVAESCEF